MTSDPQDARQRVVDLINREDILRLALELGNIYSPTGEEGPACDFVFAWMERNGLAPEKIGAFEDRYNVVGRVFGNGGGESLIFNSHLDTIMSRADASMYLDAADPTYHSAWVDDEDRIWGVPVVNCKGPMTCWLIAAKAIRESGVTLKGDLLLTSVVGEIDCEPVDEFQGRRYLAQDIGARYMINHGAVADYALVAEATNFRSGYVEAGKAFFKITVVAGPSRYTPYMPRPLPPSENPNAIVRMAQFVELFEEWAYSYEQRYTRTYAGGTVVPKASIGAIRGGVPYKIYRQPEICSMYADIRLNPDTSPLDVQEELRTLAVRNGFQVEVKLFVYRRGFEAQGIGPLQDAVRTSHHDVLNNEPGEPGAPEVSMWRDTNAFNEMGIPSLTYGPGSGAGGGNMYLKLDDMVNAAKIYALTALQICTSVKHGARNGS